MTFFQGFYDPENLNTRDPRMENQKYVKMYYWWFIQINWGILQFSRILSWYVDLHQRLQKTPCRQRGETRKGYQQCIHRPGGIHHHYRERQKRGPTLRANRVLHGPRSKVPEYRNLWWMFVFVGCSFWLIFIEIFCRFDFLQWYI